MILDYIKTLLIIFILSISLTYALDFEYGFIGKQSQKSKRFFEINNNELKAIKDLINKRKDEISKEDESVEGFNILINNGAIAGQTVFHLHFHLIPRRKNDSSQENFFSNLGKARS